VEIHVPALRERKDDIPLLFRKFVADFADQNAIPRISLTEDAKALLKNYYWGGNIRQLKNLAEQLCVISEEREINADMLRPYLKDNELNRAPAIFTGSERYPDEQMSERDMLYKVLNIMQHDIADLRKQLIILKAGHQDVAHEDNAIELAHFAHQPEPEVEETEAEEYHEEEAEPTTAPADSSTMEDIEKESIRRALMRNQGSRKRAAEDLHISERTLYRKIEKFGL
jgi:DNA-binding NtrC family response regulator